MKSTEYELVYEYYKYNSGNADNGHYHHVLKISDEQEALKLYDNFCKAINEQLSDDCLSELKDKYIPYSGYFTNAKLTKVIRDEIVFGDKAKLNHNKQYQNIDFSNCDHCYSNDEGYSRGCAHCENLGVRILNRENMQLAQSAKEWIENNVEELWSDYNKIFKLNMGLTKYNIYNDLIYIEAGFSCRGSYSGFDFQLPEYWLYAKNRKELIEQDYLNEQKTKQDKEKLSELNLLNELKRKAQELEKKLAQ